MLQAYKTFRASSVFSHLGKLVRKNRPCNCERKRVQNFKDLDNTVTNPDGGKTKVLEIREIYVLNQDVNKRSKPSVLCKALIVQGYRTNLLWASSFIDN